MNSRFTVVIVLLLVGGAQAGSMQSAPARAATPVDPIAAIVEAFRTHNIVTLTDPHGNVQVQAFLLSLIRDPRFPEAVNDVVIETASARYQDAIDRFVRGDDVERAVLRKAWEDHTVANSIGVQAEELIRAVRTVNASLSEARRLRVLAGDPPIDWDNITSPQDGRRWMELRDSYPADLVRRQVLDRGRRALVVYGQGHLQRRQIVANYDMSTWQAQTVVSLLERDHGARMFNVWTLLDRGVELPEEVTSWRVPSLALLRGTTLGARDFGLYSRGLGDGSRFGVKGGQLVPVPREEWKMMRMDDQFDALLYLGPPASMTTRPCQPHCVDADFVSRRLERLRPRWASGRGAELQDGVWPLIRRSAGILNWMGADGAARLLDGLRVDVAARDPARRRRGVWCADRARDRGLRRTHGHAWRRVHGPRPA